MASTRHDISVYSELVDTNYFTRDQFERVEAAMVVRYANPHSIRYQFVQRTDLDGLPFMMYATAEVEE